MVDKQDGDAVLVRQLLERGEVSVVVGVGGIMEGADHLKSVDDDQHRIQVFRQKSLHLLLEPPAQNGALRAEVDVGRGVLRDLKQAVLDAEYGVLQAEVEGGALPGGQPPDLLPLGHGHRQPQGQPGLPRLGSPGQEMQSLGHQTIHHKGRGRRG